MITLRIYEGIRSHFPARKSEWVLSGIMAGWGLWLLLWGPEVFLEARGYASMVEWSRHTVPFISPQTAWGLTALVVGIIRLAALTINGTFVHTAYGRWSPHVRALLSYGCCLVFAWIEMGIVLSPGRSTGEVVYIGLALLDFLNARDAASDAGAVDRGRAR